MLTIGICGASGSGKSTLAQELSQKIEGSVILINQDSYYKDRPHLSFEERKHINYDEPQAFEHDVLLADIRALTAGQSILKKSYDYTLHKRSDSNSLIDPADVLILEGIHMFYDPQVRRALDFKIFIRVDPDICLLRRMQRDINQRGRDVDGVAEQYLATVKPMHDRYIRNYIDHADVIVAGGGKNQRIVDILAFYINHGMIKTKDEA